MISPKLLVHLILEAKESCFAALLGTLCSSWVALNVFTSKRSLLLPEGDWERPYINFANKMVSRSLVPYMPHVLSAAFKFSFDSHIDMFQCCVLVFSEHAGKINSKHICGHLRTVLLIACIICRGGSFLLEQPKSSLMGEYFRFQWLCRMVKVTQLQIIDCIFL